MQGAKFIRQIRTAYEAGAAATFLRAKRDWLKDKVKTRIGILWRWLRRGIIWGRAGVYYIKFADGRVAMSREVLTAELVQMEGRDAPASQPK